MLYFHRQTININLVEGIMDGSFGRPEDKNIEKEFMKRIRGDKLQTINAECELEIELAFSEDKKQKTRQRGKNPRVKENQEDNTVQENQIQALQIGNLDPNRKEQLTVAFRKFRDSWKFEELVEDKLPDHFFDDGCDLSYILINIMKEEGQAFGAEELIFLELLCLEGRNHLTQSILQYYKNNMAYIIQAMKIGLNKIQQKKAEKGKGKNKRNQLQHISSLHQTENQNHTFVEPNDQEVSKSVKSKGEKTKPIKKGRGKKSNKDKEGDSSEVEDEEGMSDQSQYPEGKGLALKTVNYISWAYWYIIEK